MNKKKKITRIIAEIGNSHEGSLGIALSMIDMAAFAGADIVKFQLHLSEFESSIFEPFRVKSFSQDQTRVDYWDRIGFTLNQWRLIKKHCDSKGVEFLCSPFSIEAAKLLFENQLVKRWKIGSGEISNLQLLDFVFSTNLEVLVSTGLGNNSDITRLITHISKNYKLDQLVLMHCVSQYPTKLENSSLGLINYYIKEFDVKVGHSDHSGLKSTSYFALTYPIDYLEVHLSPNKLFFGPDTSSSLTPEELNQVVQYRNDLVKLKQSNLSRDQLFEMSKETARIFRKSLYWATNLSKGEKIKASDLIVRKPWKGVDASEFEYFVGKTVKKNVAEGSPLNKSDIE
jgi:N,N'-diacetyllegionaminate synthase